MAKATILKPEEELAREYTDRLILEQLTDLYEVVKPGELADRLSSAGVGLAAVRSLLASNSDKFAYHERRWIPAARLLAEGRSLSQALRIAVERFGGPMPIALLTKEVTKTHGLEPDGAENRVERVVQAHPELFVCRDRRVAARSMVFAASDERPERALALNELAIGDVEALANRLGTLDWLSGDSVVASLEKTAPVSVKLLGAVAWMAMNPVDPKSSHHYKWKEFNAELLSVPGFIFSSDGVLYPEKEAAAWISAVAKFADKIVPSIEIEDAVPIELKKSDVVSIVDAVLASDETNTATYILERQFEITPTVKTFPDDLRNVMDVLKSDKRVQWVGGDRFRRAGAIGDAIEALPEPFEFVQTEMIQEDGDHVDVELTDEGLSSSLRKLIAHPLATDVNDEEASPAPKTMPDTMRLVLKSVHRELGTFPLSQFPTDWFDSTPKIQELRWIDSDGRDLQLWLNTEIRLIFGLFDWWLDQPVESGAVFSLTKTNRPNVFEFAWLDQTDPVVYISSQRIEELREIASRVEAMSTFDVLREIMAHWPKGADFLTLLWEVNVVRRTSRRMLASLLSSYVCFYQRSGSPVWHYDHKKVEQGFDKTKKKFIKKD